MDVVEAVADAELIVAAELMVKRAGIKATHVPYRGSSAAMPDLMSGRVAFMFDNLPSALPASRAGKVKALAQTCATRSPSAPDLPTMEESGFPDFAIEGWYGIFAPARTPKPIVDKLSADINQVLMKMNGRLLPFGWARFLLGKRNPWVSVAVSLLALVFAFVLLFVLSRFAPGADRRTERTVEEPA